MFLSSTPRKFFSPKFFTLIASLTTNRYLRTAFAVQEQCGNCVKKFIASAA